MSELNIGKWYDPISERWIVPPRSPDVGHGQPRAAKAPDGCEAGKAQRIWDLLVDCCASG